MATGTSIEWTNATWNPVSGCTRVSAGCDHCYAVKQTYRLERMGQAKYAGLTVLNGKGDRHFNGVVRTSEAALSIPLGWKKPRRVFVNSMSDLFHEDVPEEFIDRVFAVMALCPQHTFQVLTKRPDVMAQYLDDSGLEAEPEYPDADYRSRPGHPQERIRDEALTMCSEAHPVPSLFDWPLPNVWLGTSVEDQKAADERIPHLLRCPAAVRFLSVEPLLSAVDLSDINGALATWHRAGAIDAVDEGGIHWVIVGGESGSDARPCNVEWIRSIVSQCKAAGVACFCKQMGSVLAKELKSPDSKGGRIEDWPLDLQIREFPNAIP